MSRPKKQTVDYFPHDCQHKGTMFILEQQYGNDGYSFWFKMLEILGTSEGHFIDCNNPHQWLFLTAKTRLSEDICRNILSLLSGLDAIDRELWECSNIIWSANFVERVSEAYRNRISEIPVRPDILRKKPLIETDNKPHSDTENPHTKLNYTKEKKSKERRKEKTPPPSDFSISDDVRKWAEKKGLDRLEEHLEIFIQKCKSNGYKYLDHDAAFMSCIREDWGKIRKIDASQKHQTNRLSGLNEKNYSEGVNKDGSF